MVNIKDLISSMNINIDIPDFIQYDCSGKTKTIRIKMDKDIKKEQIKVKLSDSGFLEISWLKNETDQTINVE